MASWPQIAAGQRITTAMLGALAPEYVMKTSAQTVTNSVVLVPDTELLFPIVGGGQYEMECFIRFSSLQAAGIKWQFSAPAGTSFNVLYGGPGSANATQADANTTEMRWAIHGNTTSTGMTDPRNSISLHTWTIATANFTAGATPGNVQLQWAQLVANATGSVVQAQSYIRYRRIG